MALFLVQHGESLSKDVDPERGLSEEGVADVRQIADVAKTYGVRVSSVRHSGKKRARQTAELFAARLEVGGKIEEITGINPLDDVVSFAGTLNSNDDLMLVGHLPFMEKLTSYLTSRSTENTVFKFQNGGIVCLDKEPGVDTWMIKWTLSPHIG